jgi:branched-chain amino acid transport system permease protein
MRACSMSGVMGFVALGGLAAVLVSMPPVAEAWAAGGGRALAGAGAGRSHHRRAIWSASAHAAGLPPLVRYWPRPGSSRLLRLRAVFGPASSMRSRIDPAARAISAGSACRSSGLAGRRAAGRRRGLAHRQDRAGAALGLPRHRDARHLRDHHRVLKNEDWLARGVKNVTGLPRPAPYEVDLQADPASSRSTRHGAGADPVEASSITVKLIYAGAVHRRADRDPDLAGGTALNSPWGRMMRAIRDNEVAAAPWARTSRRGTCRSSCSARR